MLLYVYRYSLPYSSVDSVAIIVIPNTCSKKSDASDNGWAAWDHVEWGSHASSCFCVGRWSVSECAHRGDGNCSGHTCAGV